MTTETDATARAQRFLDTHGEALRRDGVALDVEPGSVDDRFLDRARAGLAAAQEQTDGVTCLAVVTEPAPPGGDPDAPSLEAALALRQEIAVRLAEESFPLVVVFAEAYGIAAAPLIHAVGVDGVSDDLGRSDRWPERYRDDFRVDPGPALELAALQGAAWLDAADNPDPGDFAYTGPDRGDITEYFQTHEPGGADALTALTVTAAGGVGLFWFLSRRARLSDQRAQAGTGARRPTPVPPDVLDRLPDLLACEVPAVDPQDARSEEALDAAVALQGMRADHAVLRERLTVRIRGAGADWTADGLDPVLPPVEVAALVVLDERLEEESRAWEEHVRSGTPAAASSPSQRCALNPFHGPATARTSVAGTSAAVRLPVCEECRAAAGDGMPPDVLRVRDRRRTRPYVEVDDAYARSMFGALAPLGPAVRTPAASDPAGPRDALPSDRSVLLTWVLVPFLILLGPALAGAALSIGLAGLEGESFFTDEELAQRVAQTGPTIAGYPVGNWLRGAGFGALVAALLASLAAGIVILVRTAGSDESSTGGTENSESAAGGAADGLLTERRDP